MLKAIFYTLLRMICKKFLKFRRLRFLCPTNGRWCYLFFQGLILIGVLCVTAVLLYFELKYKDTLEVDLICRFTFQPKPVKALKTKSRTYFCPQSGIQLVDHKFNTIYIKNTDLVQSHSLKCYYHNSTEWKPILERTLVNGTFVFVQCLQSDGKLVFKDIFPLTPGYTKTNVYRSSAAKPAMNILVITMESVSKNAFFRRMPLTKDFFEKRGSILFENLLSKGRYSLDSWMSLMKNCSVNFGDKCSQNRVFLWELFHDAGYYTVYLQDSINYTMFKQKLPGIDYHWMSNAVLEQFGNNWFNEQPYCLKDKKYHHVLQQVLLEFLETKERLFVWFELNFSRENELDLSVLDIFLNELLHAMRPRGLENFAVLLISNHGRITGEFGDVRRHYAERLNPIGYLMLPTGFNASQQQIHQQMTAMSNRLTSHNNIHEIMRWFSCQHTAAGCAFVDSRPAVEPKPLYWRCPKGFPLELCPCKATVLKPTSPMAARLVDYSLARINTYFRNMGLRCAQLTRTRVLQAWYLHPLRVYKVLFMVFADGEFKNEDLFETYVQAIYGKPGQWKSYRLSYREQDQKRRCLLGLRVPSRMEPFCFC